MFGCDRAGDRGAVLVAEALLGGAEVGLCGRGGERKVQPGGRGLLRGEREVLGHQTQPEVRLVVTPGCQALAT